MSAVSDHLLRTLAAVPVSSRVLDLGCGRGRHAEPLARLGFDLYACDVDQELVAAAQERLASVLEADDARTRVCYVPRINALGFPDDHFDWVVALGVLSQLEGREAMLDALAEVRRVLRPGGWIYLTVDALAQAGNPNEASASYASDSGLRFPFTPDTLDGLLAEARFALAERPRQEEAGLVRTLQAIYRRVEADTPL